MIGPCARSGRTDNVQGYAKLVPTAACERIAAEIEHSLATAATARDAIGFVALLVGSIPVRRDAVAATIYAGSLAKILAEFAAELTKLTVDHLIERLRFQPATVDVVDVLRNVIAKRRLIA